MGIKTKIVTGQEMIEKFRDHEFDYSEDSEIIWSLISKVTELIDEINVLKADIFGIKGSVVGEKLKKVIDKIERQNTK